jgi:rfaE bifunctional protein kinase chain/domain
MKKARVEVLASELQKKYSGQKLVFVSGNFNIIHPGHLRLLNFAKTCGDQLIIGLFEDDEPGIIVPYQLRQESLVSLEAVGSVVPLRTSDVSNWIYCLKPYAVVKGKEHEGGFNPEREALRSYGGHLIFSVGEAKFSSIDLIRNELSSPSEFILRQDREFLRNHGIAREGLIDVVKKFKQIRVLTVGDLIVDEYIHCDPLGMSQEDPTIVVTPFESRTYIGGAGIVAAHVASLGASSSYITVTGDDNTSTMSKSSLLSLGVNTNLILDSSRPTTLKQRYRAGNKTLLRVSHLRAHDIDEELVERVYGDLEAILPKVDVLIFSDFNYGCLPQSLVSKIIDVCKKMKIPYIADSQASSQVGDVSRFSEATVISATEREARLAVNDFKSGLQNVANRLLEKSKAKMLIVKLGAEGALVLSTNPSLSTASVRALNLNPVDVAGAGDAMLAAISLSIAAGANLWECAYLGSVASAIQVSRVGNVPLAQDSLIKGLSA